MQIVTKVNISLQSSEVSKVVKLEGIIIAASQVKSKATRITLQCRNCKHTRSDIALRPGMEGFVCCQLVKISCVRLIFSQIIV